MATSSAQTRAARQRGPAARSGGAPRPGCSIVPPYVLEALAVSGDPLLEERAQRTLAQDAELRAHRAAPTAVRPHTPQAQVPPVRRGVLGVPARTVYDAGGRTRLPGEPVRSEGGPATGDAAADEAYAGLGSTYALLADELARDSLDGKGLPLLATVHYGQDYDNAFWDGDRMVFGDGDGVVFGRFTKSLDVIAHELAHGVTQYTSGLVYRGQPGALNEHVSDVLGALVLQRERGETADEADWLIGADLLLPGVAGVALRSMIAPGTAYDDPRLGRDPQPGHMDDYVDTAADFGGVHINSGIPNRAFVLASLELGGFAWERAGRIWYDAMTGDIAADCDFATFARLTGTAAERRFGNGSAEHRAVARAWAAVGVTAPAGEGRAPAGEGHAPAGEVAPGPDTEVVVRRTGGVAGTVREGRVRLDELEGPQARAWVELLTGPELRAAAARADHAANAASEADRFWYSVCCEAPPLDVEVPERVLGERTRELLEGAIRSGRPTTG